MKNYISYIFFLFLVNASFSQEQFSIYFESNKHEPIVKENRRLQQWILENPTSKIVAINGYTDEDGTSGYNDTLAKKRVDFIFNEVKSYIKIREDFKSRSFGENFKQAANKSENRKVTIYYILEKDLPRENEILGIKEEKTIEPKVEIDYPEKLVFDNPNGTKSEFKLDRAFMKKVGNATVGEKLTIDNLNFIVNTFAVVPESRGKLYELLLVMQSNPKLKIEIQGHLCCMPTDRVDLSTKRAKSIYSFLIANDVYSGRLSYKGFGSTQPIYPLPEKNEAERAANRRVEIVIVEN
ncbi:OmpA family protein [Flavobacterium dankookense]|uniref:OmpA family protein n=1 Tax=Flavobacterium dankookense TaxID=706186 RepID=A0A4R6QAP8_9FLAO|nr:OmpA family protein [Flavobacterium dankookense]TDP59305.1 OmpA family protein [Flavobacterium dankookense]